MRLCPSYLVFILVIILLGGMSLLGACGKKGPLYLPGDAPAETAAEAPGEEPPPAPAPAAPPPGS